MFVLGFGSSDVLDGKAYPALLRGFAWTLLSQPAPSWSVLLLGTAMTRPGAALLLIGFAGAFRRKRSQLSITKLGIGLRTLETKSAAHAATRLTVSPLRLMAGIWLGRSMTSRQCPSGKQALPGAVIVFGWPMANGTTCRISRWSIQGLTSLVTLWSGYSHGHLTSGASFPGRGLRIKRHGSARDGAIILADLIGKLRHYRLGVLIAK